MTPEEMAAAIGGEVREVYEPLRIACPTCGEPPDRRCRKYNGTVTQSHPKRRAAGRGVRVVGPFVARNPGVSSE